MMNERERADDVARAMTGDADALQRLLVHYHATLRGIVANAADVKLQRYVDPDDVLQQAYISAFKNVSGSRFDNPGHFFKWLEQIALNQLKDAQRALRRQKRAVARELVGAMDVTTSYPALIEQVPADDTSPSRRLANDEAIVAMMTCLARLSDDQREAVRLRIIKDVPVAEIAQRLGKSEVAIYALCRRGLKSLHDLMGPITHYLTRP